MLIPKTIKVGKMTYRIYADYRAKKPFHYGTIYYGVGTIIINKHRKDGTEIPPEQRSDTFWHELTHAILYDMGHKLHTNEQFVTEFSKRLNTAVLSARF